MSAVLQAFILGVVQGLTEFLPVSSSAHLILVPHFLGWPDPGLAFDVALHLGTLAGVVLFYWKDLLNLASSLFLIKDPEKAKERRLVGYIALATIPAATAGFLLEDYIEGAFRNPQLIACTLMLMGLLLWVADRYFSGHRNVWNTDARSALAIGLAQSLALVPGVSRSGITMTAALALGFSRTEAARFSFLLSIPVIAGAGILKSKEIFNSPNPVAVWAGFLGAAVAGLLAIWGLLHIVQRYRYTPFVVYRVVLGIVILMSLKPL